MGFPPNHKTGSLGLSLLPLVRADCFQCCLSKSEIAPRRNEPRASILRPDLLGGVGNAKFSVGGRFSGRLPQSGVGNTSNSLNSFLPKRKFEKLSILKKQSFPMTVQKITFKNDYIHSPGRGEPIFYLASPLGNSVGVCGTHDNCQAF